MKQDKTSKAKKAVEINDGACTCPEANETPVSESTMATKVFTLSCGINEEGQSCNQIHGLQEYFVNDEGITQERATKALNTMLFGAGTLLQTISKLSGKSAEECVVMVADLICKRPDNSKEG